MEEQKEEGDEEGEGQEEGGDTLEPKEEEDKRGAKRSAKDRLGTRRIKLDRQADLLSSLRVILSDLQQFKQDPDSAFTSIFGFRILIMFCCHTHK